MFPGFVRRLLGLCDGLGTSPPAPGTPGRANVVHVSPTVLADPPDVCHGEPLSSEPSVNLSGPVKSRLSHGDVAAIQRD